MAEILAPPTGIEIPHLDMVAGALMDRRHSFDRALADLSQRSTTIAAIASCLVRTLASGNKVLAAGNGGSAAEAQHFAAELVGRFKRERSPYAVIALTADTAILTAIGNDYGYQQVFARQVRALGQPGDVLLAFSTSGESENLLLAAAAAHERRMAVVALTGSRPNRLEQAADLAVRVPVADTPLAQELHMLLSHLLCDIVETELAAREQETV